ncbi:hypothetical protein RB653_009203 [Dictyostelium firmibasis]|uniref:Uncharacterized protein n=1 Tax=Dictyostelium firmibasis TaxID=79012 RepID=A0AAN7TTQ1_9MYCE
MSTPTRTRKLIVSPTSVRKRVQNQNNSNFSTSTSTSIFSNNNRFRDSEENFLNRQQQELRHLHDQQLYELQELQEQQINEIEELTKQRSNTRIRNLLKVLITILVVSVIYGTYSNQFQPQPIEPFHLTEPIGQNWLQSFKDISSNWYNLWSDSFKDLARIKPLSESQTLPAGHRLHEKQILEKTLRRQQEQQQEQQHDKPKRKSIETQMERMKRLDLERAIKEKTFFLNPTHYVDEEKIKKEIERQLKPHPSAPNKDNFQNIYFPSSEEIPIKEKIETIENKVIDSIDDAIYKFGEKSKELLHNIQDKKEQLKEKLNDEPSHIKKEFDSLIKEIEKANYNIFKDLKENYGEPTIERLNELKYKLNDAARESRETFKQTIESAQAIEQELAKNLKKDHGNSEGHPKPYPHHHLLNQENQIDENLIIV